MSRRYPQMNADKRQVLSSIVYLRLSACICGSLLLAFAPSAAAQMRQKEIGHYIVHTDVDSELARDLARRLDAMYEEYARRLVEFAPPHPDQQKFEVYIFAKRADYLKFTDNHITVRLLGDNAAVLHEFTRAPDGKTEVKQSIASDVAVGFFCSAKRSSSPPTSASSTRAPSSVSSTACASWSPRMALRLVRYSRTCRS